MRIKKLNVCYLNYLNKQIIATIFAKSEEIVFRHDRTVAVSVQQDEVYRRILNTARRSERERTCIERLPHILKFTLRYSPSVDFQYRIPRPAPIVRVTVDSHARRPPANHAKTWDILGGGLSAKEDSVNPRTSPLRLRHFRKPAPRSNLS